MHEHLLGPEKAVWTWGRKLLLEWKQTRVIAISIYDSIEKWPSKRLENHTNNSVSTLLAVTLFHGNHNDADINIQES